MKNFALALVFTLCFAGYAVADTCTGTTNVSSTSTTVLASSDVIGGRNYLLIQNIGATDVFCAIGETATTSKGFKLLSLGSGSLVFLSVAGPNGAVKAVPSGAVNCITASSTTNVSVCDY